MKLSVGRLVLRKKIIFIHMLVHGELIFRLTLTGRIGCLRDGSGRMSVQVQTYSITVLLLPSTIFLERLLSSEQEKDLSKCTRIFRTFRWMAQLARLSRVLEILINACMVILLCMHCIQRMPLKDQFMRFWYFSSLRRVIL